MHTIILIVLILDVADKECQVVLKEVADKICSVILENKCEDVDQGPLPSKHFCSQLTIPQFVAKI